MEDETYRDGKYLIYMSVHGHALEVGAGLPPIPIASRLECVVDEFYSIALLVSAIRVSDNDVNISFFARNPTIILIHRMLP